MTGVLKFAALTAVAWQGLAPPAWGQIKLPGELFSQPEEVITQQVDLIALGQVLTIGRARELTHTPIGAAKPVTRHYSPCTVLLSKVLKAPPAADGAKPAKGSRIELQVLALPSGSAGGAAGPPNYKAVVTQGGRYMLMIRRLPDAGKWILPYGRDYYSQPTPTKIKAVTRAVQTDTWPWGPAVGGLQVAMICKWNRWGHMIRGKETVFFRTYVALRNASKEPVTVNLRPADAPLHLEARDPNGTSVAGDVYRSLAWRLKGEWPTPAERIAPGDVIFVGQAGSRAVQLETSMDLAAGKWTIHASYENKREATEGGKTLWTGRIEAKPLPIEVLKKTYGR